MAFKIFVQRRIVKLKKHRVWREFTKEYLGRLFTIICGSFIVLLTFAIFIFLASQGLNSFFQDGIPISDFLFSSNWNPDASPEKGGPKYGIAIFILGSTLVSLGSVLISAPIAISLAIFMIVISHKLGKKILQPAMELFVGIPSVVYGWVGITLLVPLLKLSFGSLGYSLLAGTIVLSIMILPTITSISADAIKVIPKDYIEASYGLGATRWQTISRVIIPAASSGILTGIVLGIARAFGEALAVQMLIGNSIKFPANLMDTTSTMTSVLTMDMANTVAGTPWNNVMWSLALVLLIISFIFIMIIRIIGMRSNNA